MGRLLKHIKEYFNTFNHKDYTIYVDGTPTEWCGISNNNNRVVWKIPVDSSERDWHFVDVSDIEVIRLTPTTMEIIKRTGNEYKLVAKIKSKEEKAKEIIFKAKMALHDHYYVGALKYLDELRALMDES